MKHHGWSFGSAVLLSVVWCLRGHASPVATEPTAAAQDKAANPCVASGFSQGVVVESVATNLQGAKAGLKVGDVIVAWIRDDANGELMSPFDFSEVEITQTPLGPVTLSGFSGGVRRTWIGGPNSWGIRVRPTFPEGILTRYRGGEELASGGKLTEATDRWRSLAADGEKYSCAWLSPWFLVHAAEMLADTDRWRESDAFYQEAHTESADAGPAVTAQVLQRWGGTFQQHRDWPAATKYYRQALAANQKLGAANLTIAKNLNDLGNVIANTGDLVEAGALCREALAIREKVAPGSMDLAGSLNSVGNIAYFRGDLAQAEEYYRRSLSLREKLVPSGLDVAASVDNLGNVAYGRGNLAQAEEYGRQGLEIREKLAPGSLEVSNSQSNLGAVAYRRGDLARAEEYYRQSLAIAEKLAPDSLNVAVRLNNLGGVAFDRGNLTQAEDYHRQSLAIKERIAPDSLDVAFSLNNLGVVANDRGELVKAEEYYRKTLLIKQRLAPGSQDVAATLSNLGTVAMHRGDMVRAESFYRDTLAINERIAPGSLEVAATLGNLANLALDRGAFDVADDYLGRARAIQEKLAPDSLELATTLTQVASLAAERGDRAKADALRHRTLAIRKKLAPDSLAMASSLSSLGDVAHHSGDQVQAEDYYRKALAIRRNVAPDSRGYAENLAALASILRDRKQLEAAGELFDQALDVMDRQLARLGGSTDVRAGFRAQHADSYLDYVNLLLDLKKPELAFHVLERSRARTLLETLSEANLDIRQGADPSLLDRERLLQATLSAKSNRRIRLLEGTHTEEQVRTISSEITDLLTQYQEVEGLIRASSPRYAALTQARSLSASDVEHQLLDSDTMLLEYGLGADRSVVFAITSSSLHWYELPPRLDIETAARRVYELLTAKKTTADRTKAAGPARSAEAEAEYRKAATTLSQMVLGPVASLLGNRRLVIVRDGALQYVPFGSLPMPIMQDHRNVIRSRDSQGMIPLVVEHEVVSLPSASVLAELRRTTIGRQKAPKLVAVLADPVFDRGDARIGIAPMTLRDATGRSVSEVDSQGTSVSQERVLRDASEVRAGASEPRFPRLIFTRREAAGIMRITRAGDGLEAVDFNASRETAMSPALSQFRIVHLATHGLLDSEHPEFSGLVFSLVDKQGKPQNGFLDLQDVYNLNLSADLVVLSACETALGKEVQGEGLVGLTRGFMYAGAPRVVASSWQVDDMATAELMKRFYAAMLKRGKRPAAALREAQVEMWRDKRWTLPYYWAAFELQGDWK